MKKDARLKIHKIINGLDTQQMKTVYLKLYKIHVFELCLWLSENRKNGFFDWADKLNSKKKQKA